MTIPSKLPKWDALEPGDPWIEIRRNKPILKIGEEQEVSPGDIFAKHFLPDAAPWLFRIVEVFRYSEVYDGPGRPLTNIMSYAMVYVGRGNALFYPKGLGTP